MNEIRQICLAVTDRCNSRCNMCNTWKRKPRKEFTLKELEKFLRTTKLPNLDNVAISGGEPTLREDIVEIARVFNEYHDVDFVLQSNCFNPKRTATAASMISKFADLTVCCSLDGMNETHNEIRGVEGGFRKVMNTMTMLKEGGIKFLVSMTIQPENQHQIAEVYGIAKGFGADFWCRPAGGGHFFSKNNPQKLDVKAIIKQFKEINYAGHNWLKMVELYLKKGRFPYGCTAGKNSCVIMPNLDVYPCSHCPELWKLGNLREENYMLDSILTGNDNPKSCHACINEIAHPFLIPRWRSKLWTAQRIYLGRRFQ